MIGHRGRPGEHDRACSVTRLSHGAGETGVGEDGGMGTAGRFLAGFRAYATSKLCNLMTARALAAREPGLKVVAFNPGFTPGTALARNWPGPVRPLMAVTSAIAPLARFATVEQAGTDSGRATTCA
jgi:NAD(P)-dependent dehydrogenase (short-subunit alcohol dehydrogenase family)